MGLKIRNRTNQASGWIIVATSLALVILVDPMGAFFSRGGVAGRGPSPAAALASCIMWGIGVYGYAHFARPFVYIAEGFILVRNPLTIYQIPLDGKLHLSHSSRHPVATGRGFNVRLYALEQSNMMLFRGVSFADDLVENSVGPGPFHAGERTKKFRRELKLFDCTMLLMMALFALYMIFGSIK